MVQGLVRTRAVTAEGPGSTLVGELRSHRLCSVAKASKQASKQERNQKELFYLWSPLKVVEAEMERCK